MTLTANLRGVAAAALPLLLLASSVGTARAQPGMGGSPNPDLTDNDFRSEQSVRSMFTDADFTLGFDREIPAPGGTAELAILDTNPILGALTTGMSQVTYNFEPCGVVAPHVHPRGDENVFAVSGTLDVGFVDETRPGTLIRNGAIEEGTAFVIPQGYIHYVANPSCKPAKALATLPAPDGGIYPVLPGVLTLPSDILRAFVPSLDSVAIELFKADISAGGNIGVDPVCAARCAAEEAEEGAEQGSREH